MSEDRLNFRQILNKVLKYWYLFLLIPAVTLGAAYYYLKIAPVSYVATALLLIKDDEKSGQPIEQEIFRELGLNSKSKKLEDEIFIIRSTPVLEGVVKDLNLQYQYFQIGRFRQEDVYNQSPIQIVNWEPSSADSFLIANLHFDSKETYKLEFDNKIYPNLKGNSEFSGEFGKALQLPVGKLTLTSNDWKTMPKGMVIQIMSQRNKAKDIASRLGVETMGKETSALMISLRDEVPARAMAILTELIDEYNERSVEDKNQSYRNSLNLLNDRIQMVTDELSSVEGNVEDYKRRFNAVELSAEGNMLMQEMSDHNKKILENEVQMEILVSIESFLNKNRETFEFVPTNITLNNLTLANQLESFNELLRNRSVRRVQEGPSHPNVIALEKQIQNFRESIIANIQAIKGDLQIASRANTNLRSNLSSRMQSLPTRERELIEIERRKGVKENLYLYLLQKREESAISMAITVPSGKLIEPAESFGPVSPKKAQIWLIALFFGIAIPVGLVLLLESLNDKIQPEDDLEKITGVPVVGLLAQSKKNGSIVVKEKSRSVDAEMFRLLRANLAYIAPEKNLKTLLVTSSIAGEGKSFIVLNLGLTQALAGKRVILLELDLRQPKQEQYLGIKESNNIGVVNYIIDPSVDIHDIISPSTLHPNLEVISCGTKPPNPGELILSERLRELVKELRTMYDFVIIDAPPVGLVADALQMKDLAEATMFVVRSTYSRKGHLQIIKDIALKSKLPKPFIVLNGVNLNQTGAYGYTNGYGYAYTGSNGYYEKEN